MNKTSQDHFLGIASQLMQAASAGSEKIILDDLALFGNPDSYVRDYKWRSAIADVLRGTAVISHDCDRLLPPAIAICDMYFAGSPVSPLGTKLACPTRASAVFASLLIFTIYTISSIEPFPNEGACALLMAMYVDACDNSVRAQMLDFMSSISEKVIDGDSDAAYMFMSFYEYASLLG